VSRGVLLDTHAFLWLTEGRPRVSEAVRRQLENPSVELYLSVVCVFEVCIKNALGKLDLPAQIMANPSAGFKEVAEAEKMTILPIHLAHAARTRDLPLHHRDPFDRLLIGQALEEDLTLMTHDRAFGRYTGLDILWI
jgi:PIN domain nuclease of toxin-antitoxin system